VGWRHELPRRPCGVIIAIAWVCRTNGLSFLRVGDYIAPCAPIGLFFGRCANFINGELWGRVAGPDVPWAMVFPEAGPFPVTPASFTRRCSKAWFWG
jgi:phosphatidylglycerol:prolipoprotein diacylglycerol transferase